ncbi:NAD-dependent epimerase/dehydratase family protein [Candidatus Terasakiella magnetica]|nr:NAD(P)-dependent oxidoreductase [Candidatus Terasakiella magnetica]
MKRICITGADGLLGRQLVRQLCIDHKVWAVSRQKEDNFFPNRATKVLTDLSKPNWTSKLPEEIDTFFYLAQSRRFRDFPEGALDMFSVNLNALAECLDWSVQNGVKQFVYTSSGGIYGSGGNAFFEDDLLTVEGPLGYYLASKRCGELLVENYSKLMNVIILRPFFIYGKEQRADMLIPRLINKVRHHEPINLSGENGLKINPIHVSDAVRAMKSCLDLETSEKINLAGEEIMSLREIGNKIGQVLHKEPVFELDEQTANNDLIADITKMKTMLVKPEIIFKSAIEEFK